MTIHWALPVFAYLLGSVSVAILSCRLFGLPDPRTLGSGNPGATNVLRTGSKKAALLTLLGDLFKGLIPVLIARALQAGDLIVALTAVAAFLGHLYPLYHRFKGGKGVATGLGVILALHWYVGLMCVTTWLMVAVVSRISSLSALVAALLAPVLIYALEASMPIFIATLLITAMLFVRHRGNIKNLIAGKEPRIGKSS